MRGLGIGPRNMIHAIRTVYDGEGARLRPPTDWPWELNSVLCPLCEAPRMKFSAPHCIVLGLCPAGDEVGACRA